MDNEFVEIEDTYSGGFIVKRVINGVDIDIPPIPSPAVIVHRTRMSREAFKQKFGEYPV